MVAANPVAVQSTGLSRGDVLGKTLDGNFFGLRARDIPQLYAEVVRSGKSVTDGVKFIQKPLSLMNLARQVRELLDVENSADASNSPQ